MSHEGNDKIIDRERDELMEATLPSVTGSHRMTYFKKYGACYEVKDGVLYSAPAVHPPAAALLDNFQNFKDGDIPYCWDEDNYGEVTAPQVVGEERALEFLADINKEFGTNFKLSQFDGR